jgi:hypothetical protein
MYGSASHAQARSLGGASRPVLCQVAATWIQIWAAECGQPAHPPGCLARNRSRPNCPKTNCRPPEAPTQHKVPQRVIGRPRLTKIQPKVVTPRCATFTPYDVPHVLAARPAFHEACRGERAPAHRDGLACRVARGSRSAGGPRRVIDHVHVVRRARTRTRPGAPWDPSPKRVDKHLVPCSPVDKQAGSVRCQRR